MSKYSGSSVQFPTKLAFNYVPCFLILTISFCIWSCISNTFINMMQAETYVMPANKWLSHACRIWSLWCIAAPESSERCIWGEGWGLPSILCIIFKQQHSNRSAGPTAVEGAARWLLPWVSWPPQMGAPSSQYPCPLLSPLVMRQNQTHESWQKVCE